jgi:hypothetical protein
MRQYVELSHPQGPLTRVISALALSLEPLIDLEEQGHASRPVSELSENRDPMFRRSSHALHKPNILDGAGHDLHWHFHVNQ